MLDADKPVGADNEIVVIFVPDEVAVHPAGLVTVKL
jgi:hypothetical protein